MQLPAWRPDVAMHQITATLVRSTAREVLHVQSELGAEMISCISVVK